MSGAITSVNGAKGLPAPHFVLPTGGGLGYGLFILDEGSRDYLLRHIEDIQDALTRGSRMGHAVGQPAGVARGSGAAARCRASRLAA